MHNFVIQQDFKLLKFSFQLNLFKLKQQFNLETELQDSLLIFFSNHCASLIKVWKTLVNVKSFIKKPSLWELRGLSSFGFMLLYTNWCFSIKTFNFSLKAYNRMRYFITHFAIPEYKARTNSWVKWNESWLFLACQIRTHASLFWKDTLTLLLSMSII